MAGNSFGEAFRFTTWGESHGPAIGCVIDGCPPGIPLDATADLQPFLDKRRPGTSRFVTQRREPDEAKILSGVFEGRTTGTPIAIVIENTDQRSRDYSDIARQYRPGHADFAYDAKYGIGARDYRGGGRSSARETAMRVAAGAVARKVLSSILGSTFSIRGSVIQIGADQIDRTNWDWNETENNPFFCPDADAAKRWETIVDSARKDGSSLGAILEVVAEGIPAGLGEPIYGKLDSDVAAALMSINAVKGVEIGDGFASAAQRGEEAHDAMRPSNTGGIVFETNHAGGVLGGISTGQPLVARFAVKPTSSILIPRPSVDADGKAIEVRTKGRHDPCVGIRAAPIGEAMVAVVLLDHLIRQRGLRGSEWLADNPKTQMGL
ncbi:MAG: chorismate synthase [Alphaproteobacteria bacterium]